MKSYKTKNLSKKEFDAWYKENVEVNIEESIRKFIPQMKNFWKLPVNKENIDDFIKFAKAHRNVWGRLFFGYYNKAATYQEALGMRPGNLKIYYDVETNRFKFFEITKDDQLKRFDPSSIKPITHQRLAQFKSYKSRVDSNKEISEKTKEKSDWMQKAAQLLKRMKARLKGNIPDWKDDEIEEGLLNCEWIISEGQTEDGLHYWAFDPAKLEKLMSDLLKNSREVDKWLKLEDSSLTNEIIEASQYMGRSIQSDKVFLNRHSKHSMLDKDFKPFVLQFKEYLENIQVGCQEYLNKIEEKQEQFSKKVKDPEDDFDDIKAEIRRREIERMEARGQSPDLSDVQRIIRKTLIKEFGEKLGEQEFKKIKWG